MAADVVLPDGRGIEVKTTRHTGKSPSYLIQNDRAMDRLKNVGHGCLVQILDYDQARVFPIYSFDEMNEGWSVRDYGYDRPMPLNLRSIPNDLAALHGVPGDPVTKGVLSLC